MEESASPTPDESRLSVDDISKILQDREKAKGYITSCKGVMQRQSEQLKTQQNKFKTTLDSLETQHYNGRFHAVALKLELESQKILMVLRKRAALLKYQAFYTYKDKVKTLYTPVASGYIEFGLFLLENNRKRVIRNALKASWNKWTDSLRNDAESLREKNKKLEKNIKELKALVSKTRGKSDDLRIYEIQEENDHLREKIRNVENNVGLFVGEMNNLLDHHEPPGFKENLEKFAKKGKRQAKATMKTRVRHSPERSDERHSGKKSLEFKKVQFD